MIATIAAFAILALGVAAWDYFSNCGCEGVEYCEKCRNPLDG